MDWASQICNHQQFCQTNVGSDQQSWSFEAKSHLARTQTKQTPKTITTQSITATRLPNVVAKATAAQQQLTVVPFAEHVHGNERQIEVSSKIHHTEAVRLTPVNERSAPARSNKSRTTSELAMSRGQGPFL